MSLQHPPAHQAGRPAKSSGRDAPRCISAPHPALVLFSPRHKHSPSPSPVSRQTRAAHFETVPTTPSTPDNSLLGLAHIGPKMDGLITVAQSAGQRGAGSASQAPRKASDSKRAASGDNTGRGRETCAPDLCHQDGNLAAFWAIDPCLPQRPRIRIITRACVWAPALSRPLAPEARRGSLPSWTWPRNLAYGAASQGHPCRAGDAADTKCPFVQYSLPASCGGGTPRRGTQSRLGSDIPLWGTCQTGSVCSATWDGFTQVAREDACSILLAALRSSALPRTRSSGRIG